MKSLVFIGGLLVMAAGHAKQVPNPYSHCFKQAAQQYGLSESLLSAIACVESRFNANALSSPNKDGSRDYGVMQINESNFSNLGLNNQTIFDVCTNVKAGAAVLSEKMKSYGTTWEAVGAYNARTPHKRMSYAWKVYSVMKAGVCT